MFTISRNFSFCYGHRLLNYDGKCSHLHGHNARVKITLRSPKLDDNGMLLDFTKIKKIIGEWINDNLDHRVILCEKDPLVKLLLQYNEPVYILSDNPTAENLARIIFNRCESLKLPVVSVKFWETDNCCAEFNSDFFNN
ncbi:MAG: 6-carboxytetrahydropterin synthase QueD [Planctomycetaceae bacterium]|jgi:6-pyruvoyltetrahydropterin/6-carboxytetrahydropterin synthase|nr:6-carboxytetrahydropterin synthase QueD [Planctomycetaceae bacterium]